MLKTDIVIIGAGASGCMASISAKTYNKNLDVIVVEKNKQIGRKILLTGKGKCNLTNLDSFKEFIAKIHNKQFFIPSFKTFSNFDLIDFFESRGVELEYTKNGRIFTKSHRSSDITNTLEKEMKKLKVKVVFDFETVKISFDNETKLFRIMDKQKRVLFAKKLIIATGGKSYESTGSTGDGYFFAKNFNHTITPLVPYLAPLFIKDKDIRSLAGLTLRSVKLILKIDNKKTIYDGSILFTHQGVTGPIPYKISADVFLALKQNKDIKAFIDIKPSKTREQMVLDINKFILQNSKKEYISLLRKLLPKKIIPVFLKRVKIHKNKKLKQLNTKDIQSTIEHIKKFFLPIDGVAPLEEAIVTRGGVDISEVDPNTLMSLKQKNLFFAGEVLDIDGPTGGYNLTIAFSTGFLSGKSVAK